ncbi:hypothetical protein L7F22_042730 [Adiantum nelumboides]|nr:hypothetical protein [Adiantum nelumboides]
MADKRDEEGSSSQGTERVSHDEDALFKAQLVSFMESFQQLSKHPKMQELLQASKSPTQTQKASSQSLQSPRQSRSGHLQRKETSKEQRSNDTKGKGHVVEQPPTSIGHRQPSTRGLVNGQDSNEQTMRQTIPLPMSNVLDRNPRITSLFWKALFENMGTTLKFSSSFHPQTDGQSKEANSTVLDLLKCYVSEHKATWEHYLPLVEYAYNNTVHTSTGKAPFEIVEGGKKVPLILQTKDKIIEADKYVQNMDEAYRKIKLALEKTQSKQKKAAERHRRELVFSLGDWVLLRFEKARLRKMKGKERLFPKLRMRYYGSFQVCDKISDVVYRLKLPEGWKIHNAFHVNLLRPFVGDVPEDMVPEEQPEVEELDEILVSEQILAHKDRKVRGKVARRFW